MEEAGDGGATGNTCVPGTHRRVRVQLTIGYLGTEAFNDSLKLSSIPASNIRL
eukprot:gene30321-35313_t